MAGQVTHPAMGESGVRAASEHYRPDSDVRQQKTHSGVLEALLQQRVGTDRAYDGVRLHAEGANFLTEISYLPT